MLRLVRLTVLAGLLANIPQIGSAQEVETIDRLDRFTCPRAYKFTVVREKEALHVTDGDWGDGTVEFPFLSAEPKRNGGIWELTCRYGIQQTNVNHVPNPTNIIRREVPFATLVRRVRASNCRRVPSSQFELWCDPPVDRGLDAYQPDGGPPPSPGLDEYQPATEDPEPPPPSINRGSDAYQPPGETPQPTSPVNRGLDVYQPGSEAPEPPPEPENETD